MERKIKLYPKGLLKIPAEVRKGLKWVEGDEFYYLLIPESATLLIEPKNKKVKSYEEVLENIRNAKNIPDKEGFERWFESKKDDEINYRFMHLFPKEFRENNLKKIKNKREIIKEFLSISKEELQDYIKDSQDKKKSKLAKKAYIKKLYQEITKENLKIQDSKLRIRKLKQQMKDKGKK